LRARCQPREAAIRVEAQFASPCREFRTSH
jgi:hypothetical protein